MRNSTGRCQSHLVPYMQLATDLQSASSTPSASWIVPDMCNDMHDCSIATGDTWLSQQLPAILSSPAFTTQNSLLLLTWDEDDFAGNNQVTLIAAGSPVKRGYVSSVRSDHYSILSTLESSWNLAALTSNDSSSSTLGDLFGVNVPPPPPSSPCSSANVVSNPGLAPVGSVVSLNASAISCSDPQYQFWLRQPGDTWTVSQGWGASQFNWDNLRAGGG